MPTPQHTALPWSREGRAIIAGNEQTRGTIAEFYWTGSGEETDANVALGLAAPRLLASLVKRLAADEEGGEPFTEADLDEANGAIVQALGGAA